MTAGDQYSQNLGQASQWLTWGSAVVSDALRDLGKPFQAMEGGIRPIVATMATAGPAYTVRCYPGATWAMEQALEHAEPGDVIVVDAGGRSDIIIMGGLMAARAAHRQLAGVVVDGAVRDVDDIIATGLSVFSRYVTPRAGTHAEIGEWQVTICCGRVPINPGDFLVADNTGIVVVPQDMQPQVATRAAEIYQREQRIGGHLRQGKSLQDAAMASKST